MKTFTKGDKVILRTDLTREKVKYPWKSKRIGAGTVWSSSLAIANRNNGEVTTLKGEYELIEFHPYEPSAYIWHPQWDVLSKELIGSNDWQDNLLWVDDYDLFEHLEPEACERLKQLEREMEIAEQENDWDE